MVDFTDLTVSNKEENKFYKIGNCALKFSVKSKGGVAIGLASCPGDDTIHWIVIGNRFSWIVQTDKIKTPGILSEHEYRPFWVSWYNNQIRFGVGGLSTPIAETTKFKDIKYLTFSTFKRNIVKFKLQLPLDLPDPVYKEIDTGKLRWVKMTNGVLPEGALIGGFENEILYIMRVMHESALTPGKYVPSEKAGFVAWGYRSHRKTEDIEILCGYDGIWKLLRPTIKKMSLPGAVQGGYKLVQSVSGINQEPLFVCRALDTTGVIPGSLKTLTKFCDYASEEKSQWSSTYEILTVLNPEE
ncbi:uncharacterized protein LOC116779079 isoform X1 [Danaus plexippus]|uniref:uncharacterized protein LOC116779079 isoform X1 n=1 Tax=Danaus plexippus TaxID=13037 RepID=UPI0013C4E152|nr:uncharacterized protein LOC116779079 isoform X1 [Danaus plexippus]